MTTKKEKVFEEVKTELQSIADDMSDDEWYEQMAVSVTGRLPTPQPVRQGVMYKPVDQKKRITLVFPWGPSQIMGGPYRDKPKSMKGINLTREITDECTFRLPIPDFSIPSTPEASAVLAGTIALMAAGEEVYAGCGWGKGRTGLFLALLVKVADRSVRPWYRTPADPVGRVRKIYRPEAVETTEQEKFVRSFDVRWLVKMAKSLRN